MKPMLPGVLCELGQGGRPSAPAALLWDVRAQHRGDEDLGHAPAPGDTSGSAWAWDGSHLCSEGTTECAQGPLQSHSLVSALSGDPNKTCPRPKPQNLRT